jgi:hypothetical protein
MDRRKALKKRSVLTRTASPSTIGVLFTKAHKRNPSLGVRDILAFCNFL